MILFTPFVGNWAMKKQSDSNSIQESRRDFLKKAAYVAPAIATISAVPTLAAAGSNSGYTHDGSTCTNSTHNHDGWSYDGWRRRR